MHDNGDGTWTGRFRVPELHGNLLDTVLSHLTSPRRLSRDQHGQPVVDETTDGNLHDYETYGHALCELIEHLPVTGLASSQATILVTLDLQALLTGIGAAGLDTGIAITAGEARRMACEAGLVPAVLGGRSEPLDMGSERRLHTLAQRRALSLTYDTCAITGCERPFSWCEIHHRDGHATPPWPASRRGARRTDIEQHREPDVRRAPRMRRRLRTSKAPV